MTSVKRRLFSQGVSAARAARITGANYICPLCLRDFDEAALGAGELTLEHVPAKAAGGRAIILTCRTCNNTAGHELEGHSHLRRKQDAFKRAVLRHEVGSGGRAYANFGGVRLNVNVVRETDALTFQVSKHNDPAAIAASLAFFERGATGENWKNLKFDVTSRDGYLRSRARAADLKAAFLVLAAAFGYSIAMHNVMAPVRRQIADPDSEILGPWWGAANGAPSNSICIAESEGLAVVTFESPAAVMLPWPSRMDDNWQVVRSGYTKLAGRPWPWPMGFEAFLDHRHR